MTTTAHQRTFIDVVIREPAALAAAQPHQVLISAASVSILASYAGDSGFLVAPFNIVLAIGVEWAWLRGMASASATSSPWVARLNWSAFGILILWGVLWGLKIYKVLPAVPGPIFGFFLAVSHIGPVAWLSLCAAMVHAAAEREAKLQRDADAATERQRAEEQRQRLAGVEAERQRQQLAHEQKLLELEAWRQAQELKRSLRQSVTPVSQEQVSRGVTPHSDAERAVLRARVVTVIRDTPPAELNVTRAAGELGISRAMWYKLRAEALDSGELEAPGP